ncbi:unnamed protein product [Paramecium primaurelia]|uniref:RING-type domain-containing protein n=1 Tax=Paramecium primaurelia TaxID=5886 RepID=A0A8S1MKE2_PARPR|nr:unnamed protein product [Paramecium primaurelia]
MIILFYFFLLTVQQRDVEFDKNYFWTSIDKVQDQNIYRIKNLKQPYYYVQVTLFQNDLSFILMYDLNQIAQLNSSKGDYVRRTRFLKIEPNGNIIYISAQSNITSGYYNITIWGSKEEYCDNSCSYNGKCTDDGCECKSGLIGTDCHQMALEIQDEQTQLNLFGDEIQFFYLNIDDYKEMDIQLRFSTDSHQGIEIIIQLTEAIILPSQTQLDNESNFFKIFKIYDSQPLDLIVTGSITQYDNIQIVLAARQINGLLNTFVSSLIINLSTYNKYENTVSIIVIIIIVISISAAVIFIIVMFFVCKNIRKRKQLRQQERQARLRDQSDNPHQDQLNLFDFLTPVLINQINNQDNCIICLCNLNDNQEVRQTCCHHNFHSECIKEWLSKNKKECPVCRTNIAPKDVPTNPIVNQ